MAGVFDNRLVVVTGGTGSLGHAVVDRLLAAGARVRIPVFHERELERFVHRAHPNVELVMNMNLSDAAAVEAFYAPAAGLWGSVHTAGGFGMGGIEGADQPGLFDKLMTMNAKTTFLCCRAAVALMRACGRGGRIVNVAARPALCPREGKSMVAYAASKAAVASITEALAAEVAGDRIWVNAIAPSIIDTPPNRAAMPNADFATWPKIEDLAATIAFLVSPDNAVSTGGLVPVYGQC